MTVLMTILALALPALILGALLGLTATVTRQDGNPLAEKVNALLPQTQCGQCGHPGCRPYAQAIAAGSEAINKCPPGGEHTIAELAKLLGVEPLPLDGEYAIWDIPRVAFIREAECIGCTKCIQACPVDAILGSARYMHTVIASECTGCDLCVAPCPVDCIDMIPSRSPLQAWQWPLPGSKAGSGNDLIISDRLHSVVS